MTTPKKKTHHAAHATETLTTEAAMTKNTHASTTVSPHAQSTATTETATATPAASTPHAPPPTPAPGSDASFLPPPPSLDTLAAPPKGFVPANVMEFRGVAPRSSELIAMPIAVADLRRFANYTQVMGGLAPPFAQVLEAFDVTNQWSATRTASTAWDAYCRTQEGIAWSLMRPLMYRLKPAFELAATADPSITAMYPGITTLLGAKKAIAHKAVATKKANKGKVAAGEAPTHGKVGKTATRKAQRAALALQQQAEKEAKQAAVEPAAPAASAGQTVGVGTGAVTAPVTVVAPAGAGNGSGNGVKL